MFDTARKTLRGQLLASRVTGLEVAQYYIIVDAVDAEFLLNLMEKTDAHASASTAVSSSPSSPGFVDLVLGLDG